MKKTFKMENLDCANCAAKIEAAIRKIDGVNDCSISFMAQKLSIDAEDESFDDIMKAACEYMNSLGIMTKLVSRDRTDGDKMILSEL